MKRMSLIFLFLLVFFNNTLESRLESSDKNRGPIYEFVYNHRQGIASFFALYVILFSIHYGLDRVPVEDTTAEYEHMLLTKIKNGEASIKEVARYFRIFIFPGSKEDIVERTQISTDENGVKTEIHDKYARRFGVGLLAWFKYKVLDNVKKTLDPLISFFGVLWIVNKILHEGSLPGEVK